MYVIIFTKRKDRQMFLCFLEQTWLDFVLVLSTNLVVFQLFNCF